MKVDLNFLNGFWRIRDKCGSRFKSQLVRDMKYYEEFTMTFVIIKLTTLRVKLRKGSDLRNSLRRVYVKICQFTMNEKYVDLSIEMK